MIKVLNLGLNLLLKAEYIYFHKKKDITNFLTVSSRYLFHGSSLDFKLVGVGQS